MDSVTNNTMWFQIDTDFIRYWRDYNETTDSNNEDHWCTLSGYSLFPGRVCCVLCYLPGGSSDYIN
jgi:hypothetical protein